MGSSGRSGILASAVAPASPYADERLRDRAGDGRRIAHRGNAYRIRRYHTDRPRF